MRPCTSIRIWATVDNTLTAFDTYIIRLNHSRMISLFGTRRQLLQRNKYVRRGALPLSFIRMHARLVDSYRNYCSCPISSVLRFGKDSGVHSVAGRYALNPIQSNLDSQ